MSKIAYIMRGIPGSGKSTFLKDVSPAGVCCADDYHMVDGVYKFDPAKIKEAHNKCLQAFVVRAEIGFPVIAVSNTNVRVWELAPYVQIAEAFGYEVRIVRCVCPPEVAIARNVHGVPPEQIWAMHCNFEPLPAHWRETPVFTA